MTHPVLDDRSKQVLRSVIQMHIATREPVGSESLSKRLGRKLSPATIRNIMAELEGQGYLAHPHTSAGRMPTDEGYRFYVDSLLSHSPLGPREAATIDSQLTAKDDSPGTVLTTASHLLSRLSHSVGFVLAPDMAQAEFMHIDLVRLPPPRILAVLVSRTGLVTQKVIQVDENLSQDALQACTNYLNCHFAGMKLAAIRRRLLEFMTEEKALYDTLLKRVVSVGRRAFGGEDGEGTVFLDGTANILSVPAFEDIDRMRALFETFEQKSRLVQILNACIAAEGIRIVIGHENPEPGLHDMALVSTGLEGQPGWGLGVMGSTCMEYGRMITLVEHVARAVQRALTELRP